MVDVLPRRGRFGKKGNSYTHTHTHEGEYHVKTPTQETEAEWSFAVPSQRMPGVSRSFQKLRKDSPLKVLEWSMALHTPLFQMSGLQNCETVPFCCFKAPSYSRHRMLRTTQV